MGGCESTRGELMANPSKEKGTKQESNICNVINDFAGSKVAERLALHGNTDLGDIRILVDDLVLIGESKHSKSYPSVGKVEKYKGQATTENLNSGGDGAILFINLPNRSIQRMECHMQKSTLMKLHGVDRLITDERIPVDLRNRLEHALMEDGEFDWVCITLWAFMNLAYGQPAWADRRNAWKKPST